MELPTTGSRFTWNDRQRGNRVYSKIDWVFINNDWLNQMPAYGARYLPEGISDHCPIKVEQLHTKQNTSRPFRYCNIWASHLDFLEKVETAWQLQGYPSRSRGGQNTVRADTKRVTHNPHRSGSIEKGKSIIPEVQKVFLHGRKLPAAMKQSNMDKDWR
uniref:Craniofacial development protein 2-like n=1 Tax=Nicotiana tabacum TaxID=4097 RepID=A0A1S4CJG8_TOBAC|nr:PREDICTED: uncharacterized protein LOC107819740 [Nicotiana tabacum]